MSLLGPLSRTFISQRQRLHYVDWGNSAKPPLLLVHGGRDHCRSWDWTAQALCDEWHVIALDLRGHGDSDWVSDGNYLVADMVYDVAQLVHQLELAPVTIVSHSMGGNVCLRYAAFFPELMRKVVAIEGLGPSPKIIAEQEQTPYPQRWRQWIENKRRSAGRVPRRYGTIEDALQRMREENAYLTAAQARHLTIHGVNRNEDGTFTWKFDPHMTTFPVDGARERLPEIWAAISCPTLLLYGSRSFASHPASDGRIRHFRDARLVEFADAGHWLHHDQFERFLAALREFI